MIEPYYDDGTVVIYHGDCRELTPAWLTAAVLVTDPPYGIGYRRGSNPARGSKPSAGIVNDEDTSHRDFALALWLPRPAVVFGSFYVPQPAGTRQVLIWRKASNAGVVGATTGFRRDAEPVFLCGDWPQVSVRSSCVLHHPFGSGNGPGKDTGHPHAKPGWLMARLVESAPAGVVADPFMGSGTTLVAAKQLGRRAIGVEIEERWCEVAARRLSQGALAYVGGDQQR